MTKTTHTHRGTCQACGSVQAVDNVSGLVAKHGYTVTWGYFNGTCQGSGKRPAEHDVSHTRVVINFCIETAANHDDSVADLKSGAYVPQATPAERAKTIALAIHEHEMHASGLRSHADGLTRYVLVRLGQPLYVAAELDAPKVKEAAPTVDVATATVTGTYKTKAARKEALDKLNRAYEKCRTTVQNAYLALPHAERTEAKTEVYYGPYQLNHWRAKHSAAVLNEFPSLASTVAEIEALVKAREAVKAAP